MFSTFKGKKEVWEAHLLLVAFAFCFLGTLHRFLTSVLLQFSDGYPTRSTKSSARNANKIKGEVLIKHDLGVGLLAWEVKERAAKPEP